MPTQRIVRSNVRAPFIALIVVWAVCATCLTFAFWPISAWFRYPLVYEGDGLWNLFVIKTVLETGWYGGNSHLGAPFSATFLDFPKPESLYLLAYHVAGWVTDNPFLIHNAFYFAGFLLVAASALFVFRSGFHLAWPLSIAGALLYTFLPFHFQRQEHLFLANYFVIPLAVWIALQVAGDQPPFFEAARLRMADWRVWLVAAIVASTSIYYTFFALLLIAGVGCLESVRTRLWRHCASALLVCTLISAFVACNLASSILYRMKMDANDAVAVRSLAEGEMFALRPIQLLLPPADHRFPAFSEVARRYEAAAPFVNENRSSSLGMIGGIGLLVLLVALVAGHRIIQEIPAFGVAARVNVIALSASIVGGGAMMIGLLTHSQFRAMNRASVLIAFVSIAAVLILLNTFAERISQKSRSIFLVFISVLLVAVGLWDQIPLNVHGNVASLTAEYESDKAFVQRIEAGLPDGASILQWPYTPFPEVSPLFRETVYSHLRGYLHGRGLRWSYGGMKERRSDLWHAALDRLPLAEQITIAKSSGFHGIWLDRRGISDGGLALEAGLHSLGIDKALESANKALVFFPLSPTANSPPDLIPLPALGTGFYGWEENGASRWAWSKGDASLLLRNTGANPRRVRLSFSLQSLVDRTVSVSVGKATVDTLSLLPNAQRSIDIELDLPVGRTEVSLTTPQPPVVPDSADRRQLAVAISSLKLVAIK